ncbi:28049_t:CDS:2, partial [Gigaspora margarita]
TFVISEDHIFDENILDKDCMNIRCIKDELMGKDDVINKKKNSVVSKLNKRKSIRVKSINSNIPVKFDDTFEFNNNGELCKESKKQYDLSYHRSNNERLIFGSSIKSALQSAYIQDQYKNIKTRMLSTSRLYDNKDLEKGSGRYRWNFACCSEVKDRKWIKLMEQQSIRHNVKENNFYKRLYLDQIAGYSSDEVVSTVLGSHAEIRKLSLMDMSYCNFRNKVTEI